MTDLSGFDLSGQAPSLPEDTPRVEELAAPVEAVDPTPEPVAETDVVAEAPAAAPVEADEDDKSPLRDYVVLEAVELEGETLFRQLSDVQSRNGEGAIRKAFKAKQDAEEAPDGEVAATLVVVSKRSFKPRAVRVQRVTRSSVAIA